MGRGNSNLFKNTYGAKLIQKRKSAINIQLFAINKDKQARHNEGNTTGRSVLFGGEIAAKEIIDKYSGSGRIVGPGKEKVMCDSIIGMYTDAEGKSVPSRYAIIVKGKKGDHVYPANPREEV